MEVPKAKDNITYSIGDVTFHIRSQATVRDKFTVDVCGEWDNNGKFVLNHKAFYEKLVQLFVESWDGVTTDSKAVPYSFEALMSLPADPSNDWILKLGTFIASNTGIMASQEEGSKNASGRP
jgi:hypothetical protein